MKKFKVRVEQIKEYEIEIDENIVNEKFIDDFESHVFDLDSDIECDGDKYKGIAKLIIFNRINETSHEGIGYPLIYGKDFFSYDGYTNKGINISKIDEDYAEFEIDEI